MVVGCLFLVVSCWFLVLGSWFSWQGASCLVPDNQEPRTNNQEPITDWKKAAHPEPMRVRTCGVIAAAHGGTDCAL